MSVQATTAVWKHSRSEGNQRLVLLAIADHAHPDGTHANPGNDTLALMCQISERSVRNHIATLKDDLNELVQVKGGRGPGNFAEYEIKLPGLAAFLKAEEIAALEEPAASAASHETREEAPSVTSGDADREKENRQHLPLLSDHGENRKIRVGKPEDPRTQTGRSASRVKEEPRNPGTHTRSDAEASRPRDEIWDTLTTIFGEPRTPSQTRLRGKHVKELKIAAATPDEIHRQSRLFARRFENATLTEPALVKWFGQLEPAKPGAVGGEPSGDNPRCKHGTLIVQDTEHGLWSACGECSFEDLEGRWAS